MKSQLITLADLLEAANDESFDHSSVQILVFTPEDGEEVTSEVAEEPEASAEEVQEETAEVQEETGDELTEEAIKKMGKSELVALVDQYELELDVSSFKKVGDLREAILALYREGSGEAAGDDEELMSEEVEEEADPVPVFEKGDPVRFKNGSKYEEGEILSVSDADEKASVKVGKKKFNVPFSKLELLEKE